MHMMIKKLLNSIAPPAYLFMHSILLTSLLSGCAAATSRQLKSSTLPSQSEVIDLLEARQIIEEYEHPLMPDFRNLGEAIAKFWRLEQRFPSSLDELKIFANEYLLDISVRQLNDLDIKSEVYGRILIASFNFSSPEWHNVFAKVEVNSINPELLQVSVEADTPEAELYLQESLQVFIDQLNRK